MLDLQIFCSIQGAKVRKIFVIRIFFENFSSKLNHEHEFLTNQFHFKVDRMTFIVPFVAL